MRRGFTGRCARGAAIFVPAVALIASCGSGSNSLTDGGVTPRDTAPGAPLTVTTDNLPQAQVSVKYHAVLAAAGGLRPLHWRVSEGSLPPGLSLNPDTGSIDGTPTQDGQFPITVEASDSGTPPQTDTEQLNLRVQPAPGPVSITTTALPNGAVGTAYSQTLAASGGAQPFAWGVAAGTLPPGLTISVFTGELAGTPTVVGTWQFTVRVTDSMTPSQTATQDLSLTVDPPAPVTVTTASLPGGTVGTAYSQTLAATGGVPPYAWTLTLGTLPAGLTLDQQSGEISGTPTTAGQSTFTVRAYDSYSPPYRGDKQLTIVITNPPQQDAGQQDTAAQHDAAQHDTAPQQDTAAQHDTAPQQDTAAQHDAAQDDGGVPTDAAATQG